MDPFEIMVVPVCGGRQVLCHGWFRHPIWKVGYSLVPAVFVAI